MVTILRLLPQNRATHSFSYYCFSSIHKSERSLELIFLQKNNQTNSSHLFLSPPSVLLPANWAWPLVPPGEHLEWTFWHRSILSNRGKYRSLISCSYSHILTLSLLLSLCPSDLLCFFSNTSTDVAINGMMLYSNGDLEGK